MTTLHDIDTEWLRSVACYFDNPGGYSGLGLGVPSTARLRSIADRLDALSSEVAELRVAANFAIDWLESYNVPRQATGDERDEVIDRLRTALAKGGA
jgi:hypothetical protein